MENSKLFKKGLLAVFVAVMAVAMCGFSAEAKTTKLTLYQGEKVRYSYFGIGSLKSVTSDKKGVVSAKKKNGSAEFVAKKIGKARVTSRGTRSAWIHNVTVKKADFRLSAAPLSESKLLVTLNNKTPGYFDSMDVDVIYCDAAGNEVEVRHAYYYRVTPKTVAHGTASIPYYNTNIDFSKTKAVVSSWTRSIDAKYKKYKKVKYSEELSGNYINVTAKAPYKGKGTIYIDYEVSFYDAAGALIAVEDYPASLYKGSNKKTTQIYKPMDAVTYTIKKRCYEKKY